MSQTYVMPGVFADWLAKNSIEVDPTGNPGQSIWAEWDAGRGVLHLAWWEEPECPACGQADRPQMPLAAPVGFDSWSWQHGCGVWWEPFWVARVVGDADVDADPEAHLGRLDEALGKVKARQAEVVEAVEKQLRRDLGDFLAAWTTDEERDERAGGSEAEPGIWFNASGRWEAWAYDPTTDAGDACITVTEDDLAEAKS